jgi:hypothetical protein
MISSVSDADMRSPSGYYGILPVSEKGAQIGTLTQHGLPADSKLSGLIRLCQPPNFLSASYLQLTKAS